jgi:hypothetical protein
MAGGAPCVRHGRDHTDLTTTTPVDTRVGRGWKRRFDDAIPLPSIIDIATGQKPDRDPTPEEIHDICRRTNVAIVQGSMRLCGGSRVEMTDD